MFKYILNFIILLGMMHVCFLCMDVTGEEKYVIVQEDEPTDYVIVLTGGELLRGVYADGHTLYITRTLGPLGCRCLASLCVGDKSKDLLDALKYAEKLTDLIIVTGGLGPTDDDITRETLAEFTGISLKENPKALEHMARRFGRSKDELRSNLRKQTLTPEQGTYLSNPNGTAVGLIFEDEDKVIVALPGPPSELKPMVKNELIPYLSKQYGTHSVGASLTMRFAGIGESNIDQVIQDHLTLPDDLMISSLFELGRVDLTFSLPRNTPEDKARLKELEKELLKYIGEYMYSDDGSTLEECVIQLLAENQLTLGIAEVDSGGAICASLNDVKDNTHRFRGGYVAPDNEEMARLLGIPGGRLNTNAPSSDETAIEIAKQIAKRIGSKWGLAITQSQDLKNSSPFVWMAVGSEKDGFFTRKLRMRGEGKSMRDRLVMSTLDFIRRKLSQ